MNPYSSSHIESCPPCLQRYRHSPLLQLLMQVIHFRGTGGGRHTRAIPHKNYTPTHISTYSQVLSRASVIVHIWSALTSCPTCTQKAKDLFSAFCVNFSTLGTGQHTSDITALLWHIPDSADINFLVIQCSYLTNVNLYIHSPICRHGVLICLSTGTLPFTHGMYTVLLELDPICNYTKASSLLA
jgi:hypothetical protein